MRRRTATHNNNAGSSAWHLQGLPLTVPSCDTWGGCMLQGWGAGCGPDAGRLPPDGSVFPRPSGKGLTFFAFLMQGRGLHSSLAPSVPTHHAARLPSPEVTWP